MWMLWAAIKKLKGTYWLYQEVDEHSVNDVARQVIETVDTTTSTKLAKATKEDVSEFQSYIIHKWEAVHNFWDWVHVVQST